MSDTDATPETPETPETSASTEHLGGSAIVDMVKTEIAEHPTVFSKDAEGPMLPGEVHEHATPFEYVMIAVVLCAITAFEVFLYYQEEHWSSTVIVGLLLPLSFIKFLIVASFYMHLKTDRRIYRRYFIIGGVSAFALYTAALLTLGGRFGAGVWWGLFGICVVVLEIVLWGVISKALRKA